MSEISASDYYVKGSLEYVKRCCVICVCVTGGKGMD